MDAETANEPYIRKGEYVTTERGGVKVFRFLKSVRIGSPIQASQLESVHDKIPAPVDGEIVTSNLDGDYFFERHKSGSVSFHTKGGWR